MLSPTMLWIIYAKDDINTYCVVYTGTTLLTTLYSTLFQILRIKIK